MGTNVVSILIICILLSGFIMLAYGVGAQEDSAGDEDIDEGTKEEVEVMHFSNGAKMRLMHLRFSLARKICGAGIIRDYIVEKGVDVSDLNSIIAELELLEDEIKEMPNSESHEESVEKFVDIKHESKDLIKEFRDIARELTNEEERKEIRSLLEEGKDECRENLEVIEDELNHLHRLVLLWKAKKFLERFEIDDDEFLEKIENGELTIDEIRERLHEHYGSISNENKRKINKIIKDEYNEMKNLRDKALRNQKEGKDLRAVDRVRDRAGKLEKKGFANAAGHLRKAADRLEKGEMRPQRKSKGENSDNAGEVADG